MALSKDDILARIAVERGLLTAAQVDECRKAQFDLPADPEMTIGRARIKPLGSVLVDKGLVNPDQLTELVTEQTRRVRLLEDFERTVRAETPLAQILVKINKATQNQVNKCLELQRAAAEKGAGPVPSLGGLLVQQGFVDAKAVEDAQKMLQKHTLVCTNCGVQFEVVGVETGKTYKCKNCGGIMMTREMYAALKAKGAGGTATQ